MVLPIQTTRLSSKGQLIVPKSIRDQKQWDPGMEFTVEFCGDGILLRPTERFPRTTLDQVAGCLGYSGPVKTLDEMDEGIARMMKDKHGRG
jgi:AbrB family looped-hinge helix DNA binding protein